MRHIKEAISVSQATESEVLRKLPVSTDDEMDSFCDLIESDENFGDLVSIILSTKDVFLYVPIFSWTYSKLNV